MPTEPEGIYEGMSRLIDEVWGKSERYHSCEYNAGIPFLGHGGRISLDVAPESEKEIAAVWVFYNKPGTHPQPDVEIAADIRVQSKAEWMCPPREKGVA